MYIMAGRCEDTGFNKDAHHHARGQLLGSLGGLLSVGTERGTWVVPSVHAVWIPPHHVHFARSLGPFNGWSIYVQESACAQLPKEPRTIRVSGLMKEAVQRASKWPLEPTDQPAENIAAVILDEIGRLSPENFELPFPQEPRLIRIAQALVNDPASERDLREWATWGAVSSRTLSRRFSAETGLSFAAWRQRVRLMKALDMLSAGAPITHIAIELGYSPTAFIALFRRTFGDTPHAYRLGAST
ncbi:AraC family transcriptional regulator [Comamonas testosteroni]|uniref:AraC family transcriptional regulator n=1 Tax=Comamonas testosteroni TaxID=285 RepID=UPI00389B0ABF